MKVCATWVLAGDPAVILAASLPLLTRTVSLARAPSPAVSAQVPQMSAPPPPASSNAPLARSSAMRNHLPCGMVICFSLCGAHADVRASEVPVQPDGDVLLHQNLAELQVFPAAVHHEWVPADRPDD